MTSHDEVIHLPGYPEPLTRAQALDHLPTLIWLASQPSASDEVRQFVRELRGGLR